jgi:hypothetical protein
MIALLIALAVEVHPILPGQNAQTILDRAQPGDRLVFKPGSHVQRLGKHRSMLYVDKSIDIELEAGATLQLAAGETKLEKAPEVTTDHGAPKTIDDLEVGGDYDLGLGSIIYTVHVDGENTFRWGSGGTFDYQHERVPITGDWQTLSHGVKIRFPSKSGYSRGSLWFLSYDGPEAYGIRIGHGTQASYIDGVRIFGRGTIDLNSAHNIEPSGLVKNINACVLVHGRVRNVSVEGVTMTNTMRSVMLYGEHTGKFRQGGGVTPGESFDAENISILNTRTINPRGSGYLLGHPSHRGWLRRVRCNYNYMETATTSIEPNFQLDQYEVVGNIVKSGGQAVHAWRRSTNGLIADNIRIDDSTGKDVVTITSPGAWQPSENITVRGNRNHLSERAGFWSSVAGGRKNLATGAYANVTGGWDNQASGDYAQAQGHQARARRPGESTMAAGAFATPGDAQTSVVVARGETKDAGPIELRLAGGHAFTIEPNTTVVFRALLAGRSGGGQQEAAFEFTGVASRAASEVKVSAYKVTPLIESPATVEIRGGDRLQILVRGHAATILRWVARVELAEAGY